MNAYCGCTCTGDMIRKWEILKKNTSTSIWRHNTYLPSPPHAPFGVTTTSLHWSVSVLYTSNFRGFPSLASIKEKKSSDCKGHTKRREFEVLHYISFVSAGIFLYIHLYKYKQKTRKLTSCNTWSAPTMKSLWAIRPAKAAGELASTSYKRERLWRHLYLKPLSELNARLNLTMYCYMGIYVWE